MTEWEDSYFEPDQPVEPTSPVAKKSGGNRWLIGCVVAAAGFGLVVIIGCAVGWGTFFRFGVNSDLTGYAETISAVELEATAKQELLDDIKAIRESLEQHNNFNFMSWIDTDERILLLIDDYEIDEADLKSLKSELARMKRIQGLDPNGPDPRQPGTT